MASRTEADNACRTSRGRVGGGSRRRSGVIEAEPLSKADAVPVEDGSLGKAVLLPCGQGRIHGRELLMHLLSDPTGEGPLQMADEVRGGSHPAAARPIPSPRFHPGVDNLTTPNSGFGYSSSAALRVVNGSTSREGCAASR